LKDDLAGAVALQKRFTLTPLGKPAIDPPPALPMFGNKDLIGAELFDHAAALIASALDVSPVAAQMQAKVREVTTGSCRMRSTASTSTTIQA
jgi:hypothetical protein